MDKVFIIWFDGPYTNELVKIFRTREKAEEFLDSITYRRVDYWIDEEEVHG